MDIKWSGSPPDATVTNWHWLLPTGHKLPLPVQWLSESQCWQDGDRVISQHCASHKFAYVEPVYFATVKQSYTHYSIHPPSAG